jgi:hypothetical protein
MWAANAAFTPPTVTMTDLTLKDRARVSSAGSRRLLRARREWPRDRCAAEKRDEIASLHALPPQGVRVAHYHSVARERCCASQQN